MKIFVLYSKSGYEKYKKAFDKIKQIIDNIDGVTRIKLETDANEGKLHNQSVKRKIFEADAVIIDTSESSFRLGHEATIAVQKGKPTLILSQHKDYSDLLDSPNLYGAKYAYLELEEIIQKFIKAAKKRIYSRRFNMFISEEQEEFIEAKATKLGINKSEFVRKLIDDAQSTR